MHRRHGVDLFANIQSCRQHWLATLRVIGRYLTREQVIKLAKVLLTVCIRVKNIGCGPPLEKVGGHKFDQEFEPLDWDLGRRRKACAIHDYIELPVLLWGRECLSNELGSVTTKLVARKQSSCTLSMKAVTSSRSTVSTLSLCREST